MRRYNIYASMPLVGRYELMKENQHPGAEPEDDYWNECFTWQELKNVIPFLRSQGWKFELESITREQIGGRLHMFSISCGVNHDFRTLNISGMRIIMARDFSMNRTLKESLNPIGY